MKANSGIPCHSNDHFFIYFFNDRGERLSRDFRHEFLPQKFMNELNMSYCIVMELAKLMLRSDEKMQSLSEGALKFLNTHLFSFNNSEILAEKIKRKTPIGQVFQYFFGEDIEPCYLPFAPGDVEKNPKYVFLLHIFKGEQDIVPIPSEKISTSPITAKQYYRIFHNLRHDIKKLESAPSVETWLQLFQRYAKWMPANNSLPYVSLCAYAKLKMALCACISDEQLQNFVPDKEGKIRLNLCTFQIKGKDEFLSRLNLHSDLNLMKGGMYYWQLLRECLVQNLLETYDLPFCNCLSESDEKIILLLPENAEPKLEKFQEKIEEIFLKNFQGILGVCFSLLPISLQDLKEKNFSAIAQELFSRVEQKKNGLFQNYISQKSEDYPFLFGPFEENSQQALAQTCRELGTLLAQARWTAIGKTQSSSISPAKSWQESLACLNTKVEFFSKKNGDSKKVYRFGNTDFAHPQGIGFKFSDVLPYLFEEEEPIINWTILHLKIDDIPNEMPQSICAYLTTQEFLADFFKTYLSSLLREKKYRKYSYFLLAEGQQVSLVCASCIALSLVSQIQQKFAQFTSERFTLSGRISIFPSQYPLYPLLREEKNKFALQTANKITILDETFSWNALDNIIKTQEKLSVIAKLKGKKFLFPLFATAERYRILAKNSKKKKDGQIWRHLINYYLTRLGITDNLDAEKGPAHLSLSIQWSQLVPQEN